MMARPTPPPDLFTRIPTTPSPKRPKTKKEPLTPKLAKSSMRSASPTEIKEKTPKVNGTWTAEKKGMFMDEVIAAGYRAVDLVSLAEKVRRLSFLMGVMLTSAWDEQTTACGPACPQQTQFEG